MFKNVLHYLFILSYQREATHCTIHQIHASTFRESGQFLILHIYHLTFLSPVIESGHEGQLLSSDTRC